MDVTDDSMRIRTLPRLGSLATLLVGAGRCKRERIPHEGPTTEEDTMAGVEVKEACARRTRHATFPEWARARLSTMGERPVLYATFQPG